MSLTTDESTREPEPSDHALSANDLETLEALINKRQRRRDGWTLLIWAFAAVRSVRERGRHRLRHAGDRRVEGAPRPWAPEAAPRR